MGGGSAGGAPHYNDTFHHSSATSAARDNPLPAGGSGGVTPFDDTIETWGEPSPSSGVVATDGGVGMEEWGEEWTGSLETTNVFVSSQSGAGAALEPTPPPASDLTAIDAAKLVNSSPMQQQQQSYHHHQMEDTHQQLMHSPPDIAASSIVANNHQSTSYSSAASNNNNSLSAAVLMPPMPGTHHHHQQPVAMNSAAMGLAALLQKAAPQSTLTGLGTASMMKNSSSGTGAGAPSANGSITATTNGSIGHLATPNILGGINTNVGDVIKASSGGGSSVSAGASYAAVAPTVPSMSHYAASQQHNSMFSSGELTNC